MRSHKTEGIIIKRKNFGEADRILTIFTKTDGKIQVIAKGVRKIKSRRSSHVELLNHSVLSFYKGKMFILTEADTIYHYSGLKTDLKKSGYAFYVCELVNGLCADSQENRGVFNLLSQTLRKMETEEKCQELIPEFEKELLILLGFWSRENQDIENSQSYIEDIMERKIKTRKMLTLLS